MVKTQDVHLSDAIGVGEDLTLKMERPSKGFITEVDFYNGFGKKIMTEKNTQVLGGSIWTLEKLWNIRSPLKIDTINNIMGVEPIEDKGDMHTQGNAVYLFGVGTEGADQASTVYPVDVKHRELAGFIPFQVLDDPITQEDSEKYFFKKDLPSGQSAYYLKRFEQIPELIPRWKDGTTSGSTEGTIVEENPHESTRKDKIETYVSMKMRVRLDDLRKYFELKGEIEQARFSSLALFAGEAVVTSEGYTEYVNVRMISELHFKPIFLDMEKEVLIHYRVYNI